MSFMIWTGVTASAEESSTSADDTVSAITDAVGSVFDTAIEVQSPDATVSAGAGVSVDLSSDASEGISVESATAGDLEIGLPFADAADAADDATVVDGVMVYDNTNGSTTTPLVHEDGSLQILTTIADSGAPSDYEYQLALAPGGALVLTDEGGVDIVEADGSVSRSVAAPWAFDALGIPVSTHYVVDGGTLTQVIEHDSSSTYPIVADPKVSYGWGVYYHFNKAETITIGKDWLAIAAGSTTACAAVGAALGSLAPVIGTAIGGVIGGAACLVVVGPIAWNAGVGYNTKPTMRCLYVRVLGSSISSGTYSDSRCK